MFFYHAEFTSCDTLLIFDTQPLQRSERTRHKRRNLRWVTVLWEGLTCRRNHWRQPRWGCRGHIPPIFWLGGTSTGISPPILLRTFGYSRPILVALRSLSLKPFSFGYKTPPIRFSQAGGQSAHKARPPNLELALTPLNRCNRIWRNHVA